MAFIALDYGHGADTFPPNKGLYKNGKAYHEHQFNSTLGLKIKKLLESYGHKVLEGQPAFSKEVGLSTRTNLYNMSKVDIVISLHANGGKKSVDGRCAFYWHSSKNGKRLAQLIIDKIKDKGYSTHGNGLHASKIGSWTNLHICRKTQMPAVLVENGFMTNDEDFELIFGSKQDQYTDDLAKAYAEAVHAYFDNKIDKPVSKSKPKPETESVSKSTNKAYLRIDGKWGNSTTKALQRALGTPVDGILSNQSRNSVTESLYGNTVRYGKGGSVVIRALQRKIGSKADGLLGPATVRALQKHLGTVQDGVLSRPSLVVKEFQRRLNAGVF